MLFCVILFSPHKFYCLYRRRCDGNDDNAGNDREEISVCVWDTLAKKISAADKSKCPDDAADDVIRHKCLVMHFSDSCNGGHECANNRYESCEDDRFFSVCFEEFLRFFDMILVEKESLFFMKNLWSKFSSNDISCAVPDNCGDAGADEHNPDIEMSLRCQKSCGEEEAVAGKKKSCEKS